jgi:hypothetical protein
MYSEPFGHPHHAVALSYVMISAGLWVAALSVVSALNALSQLV